MMSPSRSRLFAAGLSGSIVATRMPLDDSQTVEADDLPRDRRVLSGDAHVRAPNPAVANQPADDELRGVRGDRKTQPLRAGDDGRVDADHFAARVDERSAGVSRIERRVGLDDVVHQAARSRSQRSPERADDAGRDGGRESERVADRDDELPDFDRLRIAKRAAPRIPTPPP